MKSASEPNSSNRPPLEKNICGRLPSVIAACQRREPPIEPLRALRERLLDMLTDDPD